MPAPTRRRVFVVDDHAIVRQGISMLMENETNDLGVCGESDGSGAILEEIAAAKPDLVLLDLSLDGPSGLDWLPRIRSRFPDVRVLVLSMHRDFTYADRALKAGAHGYLVKSEAIDLVLTAAREVLNGRRFLSPELQDRFLSNYIDESQEPPGVQRLSAREFEVFQMIAEGKNTREIAEALHLSVRTVESYQQSIKQRLDLKRARDVYLYAVRWKEREMGEAL